MPPPASGKNLEPALSPSPLSSASNGHAPRSSVYKSSSSQRTLSTVTTSSSHNHRSSRRVPYQWPPSQRSLPSSPPASHANLPFLTTHANPGSTRNSTTANTTIDYSGNDSRATTPAKLAANKRSTSLNQLQSLTLTPLSPCTGRSTTPRRNPNSPITATTHTPTNAHTNTRAPVFLYPRAPPTSNHNWMMAPTSDDEDSVFNAGAGPSSSTTHNLHSNSSPPTSPSGRGSFPPTKSISSPHLSPPPAYSSFYPSSPASSPSTEPAYFLPPPVTMDSSESGEEDADGDGDGLLLRGYRAQSSSSTVTATTSAAPSGTGGIFFRPRSQHSASASSTSNVASSSALAPSTSSPGVSNGAAKRSRSSTTLRARFTSPFASTGSFPAVASPASSPWAPSTPSPSSSSTRLTGSGRTKALKHICTTPGRKGAGETETEVDEPPNRLPTTRIIAPTASLIPPNSLQARLTPLLFELSRLLAIVPAFCGVLWNAYHIYLLCTTKTRRSTRVTSVDYAVSILWAFLTGYQALSLTTGLLTRWRIYYPPLSTLIRLLALQAICWPATHYTLKILDVSVRPTAVWAVVGTTTCVSRAVQIWVTSNLWWEGLGGPGPGPSAGSSAPGAGAGAGGGSGGGGNDSGGEQDMTQHEPQLKTQQQQQQRGKAGYWKRWRGGNWGGRRWDWKEVGVKCMLPAGVCYFVMAWADVFRREFFGDGKVISIVGDGSRGGGC